MDDHDDIARADRAKRGSPFLNAYQAAAYLKLSERLLRRLRSNGAGPVFRRHTRVVQYHIDDLDAWSRDRAARAATRNDRAPRSDRRHAPGGVGRSAGARARRRRRFFTHIAVIATGSAIVLASAALPPAPRFVWNASASAPLGLYAVAPGASAVPGAVVIARLPARYRRLAALRRYLPLNVPVVKRVAAYAGDDVCALGANVFVNGRRVAVRRAADRHRRALPAWQGCVRLHGRQLFLLNADPASFDGRYVGVTDGADVIGTAKLLWPR